MLQVAGKDPRRGEMKGGMARPMLKVRFKQSREVHKIAMYDLRDWWLPGSDYGREELLFFNFITSKGGEVSFREYIEF